jgi:hypothetical protein
MFTWEVGTGFEYTPLIFMKLKKTSAGNRFGYYLGYYVFAYRKPHGAYCCWIGKGGKWLFADGNFGAWMWTLRIVKKWAGQKIRDHKTGKIKAFFPE